jgi:serine/threonine protein kinase
VASDGSAKLSDFGLSTIRTCSTLSGQLEGLAGALRWRAPECLMKSPSFASDVYSLAMCILEAVTDQVPFGRLDDEAVRENLRNGNIPERPKE